MGISESIRPQQRRHSPVAPIRDAHIGWQHCLVRASQPIDRLVGRTSSRALLRQQVDPSGRGYPRAWFARAPLGISAVLEPGRVFPFAARKGMLGDGTLSSCERLPQSLTGSLVPGSGAVHAGRQRGRVFGLRRRRVQLDASSEYPITAFSSSCPMERFHRGSCTARRRSVGSPRSRRSQASCCADVIPKRVCHCSS